MPPKAGCKTARRMPTCSCSSANWPTASNCGAKHAGIWKQAFPHATAFRHGWLWPKCLMKQARRKKPKNRESRLCRQRRIRCPFWRNSLKNVIQGIKRPSENAKLHFQMASLSGLRILPYSHCACLLLRLLAIFTNSTNSSCRPKGSLPLACLAIRSMASQSSLPLYSPPRRAWA